MIKRLKQISKLNFFVICAIVLIIKTIYFVLLMELWIIPQHIKYPHYTLDWIDTLGMIPFMAFLEEIIFRTLPIAITIGLISWCKIQRTWLKLLLVISVCVSISILFGGIHPDGWSVVKQGVGGFLYVILFMTVYLKKSSEPFITGEGKKEDIAMGLCYGTLACAITHTAFNWIAMWFGSGVYTTYYSRAVLAHRYQ